MSSAAASTSNRKPRKRLLLLLGVALALVALRLALNPLLKLNSEAVGAIPAQAELDQLTKLEERVRKEPNNPEAFLELGTFYGKNRQYLDAAEAFRTVIRLGKDEAEMHRHLAASYQNLGRFDEAIKERKTSIRMEPNNLLWHLSLAHTYAESGRSDLGLAALRAIPKKITHPSPPPKPGSDEATSLASDLGEISAIYGTCGDAAASSDLLKRALTLDPEAADLHALLARNLITLGDPAGAVPHLKRSLTLVPEMADTHYLLAVALIQQRRSSNWKTAQEALEGAIRINPKHSQAYFQLGELMAQQNRWKDAANAYKRAYDNEFPRVPALEALARALEKSGVKEQAVYYGALAAQTAGREADALVRYEKLAEFKEMAPTAWVQLSDIHKLQHRPKEQLATIQKAIALVPNDPDLERRLGMAYLANAQPEKFEAHLKRATELDPQNADLNWRELGAYYHSRGRPEESEMYFKKCLDVRPNESTYLYSLGKAYLDRMNEGKNKELAIEYLEKATQHAAGGDGAVTCNYQLGIAYQRLERFDDAAAAFRRVINIDPGYGEAYLNLGQVYRKMGKEAEAREMLALTRRYRDFVSRRELLETRQKAARDSAQSNFDLGNFYLEAGARSAALPYLEKTVELDASHLEAHRKLAYIYGLDGRREDEERSLKAVARLGREAAGRG